MPSNKGTSPFPLPDGVETKTPSAKLVYISIWESGTVTRGMLKDRLAMPSSSISNAIKELEGVGLVKNFKDISDPSRSIYLIEGSPNIDPDEVFIPDSVLS